MADVFLFFFNDPSLCPKKCNSLVIHFPSNAFTVPSSWHINRDVDRKTETNMTLQDHDRSSNKYVIFDKMKIVTQYRSIFVNIKECMFYMCLMCPFPYVSAWVWMGDSEHEPEYICLYTCVHACVCVQMCSLMSTLCSSAHAQALQRCLH